MKRVGIKDLKTHLSSYIDSVVSGEEVVITEHGKEVALIVPISKERRAITQLMEAGKASWQGGKPRGIDARIEIEGKPFSETVLEKRQ